MADVKSGQQEHRFPLGGEEIGDLSPQDRADLVAFLQSLTDDQFLTDPRHSNPWKQGAN